MRTTTGRGIRMPDPRRLAYADPPYPGQAARYKNGQEVNHRPPRLPRGGRAGGHLPRLWICHPSRIRQGARPVRGGVVSLWKTRSHPRVFGSPEEASESNRTEETP